MVTAAPQEPRPAGDRRAIGPWAAFLGGQAAIGGNLFVALGLVVLHAGGAAPAAFAISGLVLLLVALAYIEFSTAFPVAGGGYFFVLRSLGDFWGFIAGAALVLDLTIGIVLFAAMGASYASVFSPALLGVHTSSLSLELGPLGPLEWVWFLLTLAVAALLIVANIRGLKEKAAFTIAIGAVALAGLSGLVVHGFLFAWRPGRFREALAGAPLAEGGFAYGLSLAVISFVGLQTIALTASEARRPGAVLPRASLGVVLTTVLLAVALSVVALGTVPAAGFGDGEAPLALMAAAVPSIGPTVAGLISALACVVLLVSANSFLACASYVAHSMGEYDSLGAWSRRIRPPHYTPVRALVVLGGLVMIEATVAFLWPGNRPLEVLANMYAFGALLAYSLVLVALIRLRVSEPALPRPWRVPVCIPLRIRGTRREIPILPIAGLAGTLALLILVTATHEIGRVAGPAWIMAGAGYYLLYRRSRGLPLLGSVPRRFGAEGPGGGRTAADSGSAAPAAGPGPSPSGGTRS